jgi:HIRAN domain-containing protein
MFERAFDAGFAGLTDKRFYTKVAGTTFPNPDGSSRPAVIEACKTIDSLMLRAEPDNPFDPNAIAVCRKNGDQLGYLDRRLAGEITRDIAAYGPRWVAIFRKPTHRETTGEVIGAVIYIARLSADLSGG